MYYVLNFDKITANEEVFVLSGRWGSGSEIKRTYCRFKWSNKHGWS